MGRSERRGPVGRRALTLGLALLAFGALLAVTAEPPRFPVPSEAPGAAVHPSGNSDCSTLTSNATLGAQASELSNNSTDTPRSSVAASEASADWGSVCTSAAFQSDLGLAGEAAFSALVYTGDKNWSPSHVLSGSIFVEFDLRWNASCPSVSAAYPAGFGCVDDDRWVGNLTTDALVGPIATIVSQRVAGCTYATSNASLVFAIDASYPNASVSPSRAAAESAVQVAWGEVCSSLGFYDAYSAHVSPVAFDSEWLPGTGTNGSGSPPPSSLHVTFEIGWTDACPADVAANATCDFEDVWNANLSNGSWSGPALSVSQVSLGCGPGCATSPGPEGPLTGTDWLGPILVVAIVGGSVATFVGVLLWASSRRGSSPPPPDPPSPPAP